MCTSFTHEIRWPQISFLENSFHFPPTYTSWKVMENRVARFFHSWKNLVNMSFHEFSRGITYMYVLLQIPFSIFQSLERKIPPFFKYFVSQHIYVTQDTGLDLYITCVLLINESPLIYWTCQKHSVGDRWKVQIV